MQLHFSIEGEFITKLARERFYVDHQLSKAIEIVWTATETDQLTDIEHLILCIEVISGSKSIVGTYPGDDYGIKENKESNITIHDFINEIDKLQEKIDKQESEYNELLRKYLFVCERLSDSKMRSIDYDYRNEYDEHLFDLDDHYNTSALLAIDKYNKSNPVDSYISHMKDSRDDDYGWLEPDGTYHPVEWGHHSDWAREYADKHYPFKDYANMYWKTDAKGERHHYVCGDFLVYVLGWVLLDSPYQGIATPKYDQSRRLTKAQKEFLYDYYIDRNLHDRANEIYKDD